MVGLPSFPYCIYDLYSFHAEDIQKEQKEMNRKMTTISAI
jgi:hypothetical protein